MKCPKNYRAFSGGFDGNLNLDTTPVNGVGAIESFRGKGRVWRFTGITVSDNSPGVLTGSAYCVRKA